MSGTENTPITKVELPQFTSLLVAAADPTHAEQARAAQQAILALPVGIFVDVSQKLINRESVETAVPLNTQAAIQQLLDLTPVFIREQLGSEKLNPLTELFDYYQKLEVLDADRAEEYRQALSSISVPVQK